MNASSNATRYHFGPLERRGLIAGWRTGQLLSIAAGALGAILIVGHRASAVRVGAALVSLGMSIVVAWLPIRGQSIQEWLPLLVMQFASGATKRRRRFAAAPSEGRCLSASNQVCATRGLGDPWRKSDGPFGHLSIRSLGDERTASIGVIVDSSDRSVTALIEVGGESFSLLGRNEQDRRVSGWSALLASLAREHSVLHRVGWMAATLPDDGAALGEYLVEHASLAPEENAYRSYRALLTATGTLVARHRVVLAVTIRLVGAAQRQVRAQGGGMLGVRSVLVRELDGVIASLRAGEVERHAVLDADEIEDLVVSLDQSTDRPPRARRDQRLGPGCASCPSGWPWPLSVESNWAWLRCDDAYHATFWIAEWPRVEVGAEFLAPLLIGSTRRRVTVVMEPQPPFRAVRRAEAARTADAADAKLRQRAGFLQSARRTNEAQVALRRERELAEGHGAYRFSGYVTVSAHDEVSLAKACAATEQAASHANLWMRRLYGRQLWGYLASLPTGHGLR